MQKNIRSRTQWEQYLNDEAGKRELSMLYGEAEPQTERYLQAFDRFQEVFGHEQAGFFSAPGRTELSGNHTDHQRGRVLAGSVTSDMLGVALPRADMNVRMFSEGYTMIELDLCNLEPQNEYNHSAGLIRGVAAGLAELGYQVGGYDIYVTSSVPKGSGLSSSAALEILLGTVLNHLYNDGSIDDITLAKVGQFAENVFFGKPSGLLDQMACALGGISTINFAHDEPEIERIDVNFRSMGYEICIVDAGGSHAGLTDEYAAIPQEMKWVATALGKTLLSEVDEMQFYAAMPQLRQTVSDRALVRAIHFFRENDRVVKQVQALRDGDIQSYLELMLESGHSSFEYLQNIYPSNTVDERSVSLALSLSERMLQGKGAWRVHGGGFAGTIQALVPLEDVERYTRNMELIFGAGSVFHLRIRPVGGYCLGIQLREQVFA